MTALPPDLREALETVRSSLVAGYSPHTPTRMAEDLYTQGTAALALIEQRLVEYDELRRSLVFAGTAMGASWVQISPRVGAALAALSPQEKP